MRLLKSKTSIISLAAQLAAFVLETLPYGVCLIFAPGPNERLPKTFSYFDLTPVGYGNFLPFLAGILTVVILLLSLIHIIKKQSSPKLMKINFVISVVAFVFSVTGMILLGADRITGTGIAICALLLLCSVLQGISIYRK